MPTIIPPELQQQVTTALRLMGSPHLRPDADYSQGTADVFYKCPDPACPYSSSPRQVKETVAEQQPVAALGYSTTCACGREMLRRGNDPVVVDPPKVAKQLAADAAASFYTPEAWALALKVRAERDAADAAAAPAVPEPSPGDVIAGKVLAALTFESVKVDIAEYLRSLS